MFFYHFCSCVTTGDQPFHPVAMEDDQPKPKVKKHVRIKAVAVRRRIRRKPADLDRVVSLDTLARDQRYVYLWCTIKILHKCSILFCRAIASFESYLVSIYGSSSRELHSLQAWKAIGTYCRIPESKESQRIAKGIKIHKYVVVVVVVVLFNVLPAGRSSIKVLKSKIIV